MAENQDWDLPDKPEQQQETPEAAGDKAASTEPDPPPAGGGAKSSLPRVLLLLLLLAGLGAAAFYYFAVVPQGPAPTAGVKPQRQPIPIPVPPAPKAAQTPEPQQVAAVPAFKEKSASADALLSGAAADPPATEKGAALSPAPRGVLKEVLPVEEPAATAAQKESERAAIGVSAKKSEPVALAGKLPVSPMGHAASGPETGQPATDPLASIAVGHYMVEAGVFLKREHFEEARLALEKIGFEPRAVPMEKEMEMTRLWVGTFAPEEARRRYQQLKAVSADAFLLPEGDELAVFAGSYHDLDEARARADQLFAHSIEVTEQTAMVTVPLTRLNFGDYAKRAEAQEAAARAEAAGLSTYILKKR